MRIVNLFKYYGDNIILDSINLEIKNKGLYLIYGDSGQGKTTLFNIIFKQENYDDGYIDYNNDKISFCKSTNQLIEILTPLDMVSFISNDKESIDKYFNYFSLTKVKNKRIVNLSSGERQRLQIILTLLSNANILLFDEPSSNLDKETSNKLYLLLKEETKNRAIIMICHDFDNASKYADAIYKLENHKLICNCDKTDLVNNEGKDTNIKAYGLIKYAIKTQKYHPVMGIFNLIFSCLLIFSLTILLGILFVNAKDNAQDMSYNLKNDIFTGRYVDQSDKTGLELNKFKLDLGVSDFYYDCTGLFYEDLKDTYNLEKIEKNECLISKKALAIINDSTNEDYKIGSNITFNSYGYNNIFKIKGYNNLNLNFEDSESNLIIVIISKDFYESFIKNYGIYDYQISKEFNNFVSQNDIFMPDLNSCFNLPIIEIPNVDDVDLNYNGYAYIGCKPVEINEIMVSSIDLYRGCNKELTNNELVNNMLESRKNFSDDNTFKGDFFKILLDEECLKEIKVVGCAVEIKNGVISGLESNYISDKLFSLLSDKISNEGKYAFDDGNYCFDKSSIKDIYPLILNDKLLTSILKRYIYSDKLNSIFIVVTLVVFIISFLIEALYNNLIAQYLNQDFEKLATYNFNKKDILMFELITSLFKFIIMVLSLGVGLLILKSYLKSNVGNYSYGSWKTNYPAVIILNFIFIIALFGINILFKNSVNNKKIINKRKMVRTWEA